MRLVRDYRGYVFTPFGGDDSIPGTTYETTDVSQTPPTPNTGGGAEQNTTPPGGSSGSSSNILSDLLGYYTAPPPAGKGLSYFDALKQATADIASGIKSVQEIVKVGQGVAGQVVQTGRDVGILPPAELNAVPPRPRSRAASYVADSGYVVGKQSPSVQQYVTPTALTVAEINAARGAGSTAASSGASAGTVVGYGAAAFVLGKVLGLF